MLFVRHHGSGGEVVDSFKSDLFAIDTCNVHVISIVAGPNHSAHHHESER
jgi:hypothetical protein